MKILLIHNNYASNTSGEEFAAEAIERLLINNGHEVAWYRRFSDVIDNSFAKKVSAFFLGIYNPKAIKEIKDLLEDFNPDVVQIQNLYPFISPSIIRTIKRKGIPIVMRCPNYRLFCPTGLHLDGNGKICEKCLSVGRELNCVIKNCEKNYPKSIGYALRNFFARTVWGITTKMDAYLVQTAFQREKFIKNGIPPKKLFIVPALTPAKNKIDATNESLLVSFVGRISEEKGIVEFLEAARLLPTIPFIVVGDIDAAYTHLRITAPENVTWKGFAYGKDLERLFNASKIVVVPSKWYEGFPNVITQAMKHGKPVIANNLGAMPNIIDSGENGVLVDPGDSLGLAEAIRELYADTEKCNLYGMNAKRKADTVFTADRVYENLEHLYHGLLVEKERKKKCILFLLHYPPPVHGAAMVGQYIMESNIINESIHGDYVNLGTSISVDEIGHGDWLKVKRYLKILRQTINRLYRHKPKLVYMTLTASGSGFYKDALIVMLIKLFDKKIVFHFHNKGVSSRQNKWLDNLLYKMVFRKSEVILLSEHLYYDIQKYVSKKRVHFCANGIPEKRITEIKEKESNVKVQLLFLSNLIESKGVFILMKACQILQSKQLPFHCTFIGSEGDISVNRFQEKLNEFGINKSVHYAGRKYGLDKEAAYSQSDIFVFPTYYHNETFGLVNLEAMQYSLPVVSTFEGGIPEVVIDGKTGFLVKQEDAFDLAEKLEILIKNPALRINMGKAGKKRYEEQFTLELFEKRFSQILKELI